MGVGMQRRTQNVEHVGRDVDIDLGEDAISDALDEHEAWAVVSYIRTLQASRGVSIDSDIVPSVQRSRLMEQQGSPVGQSDESTPNATGSAIAEGGEQ